MRVRARIETISRTLERLEVHYGLGVMNGTLPEPRQAEKLLASIEKDVETLSDLVTPKATAKNLSPVERITTLVDALEQLALVRGNHLYRVDALHGCAVQFMPEESRGCWLRVGPYKLAGLISHQPAVAAQLEKRGILVWRSVTDGLTRLVNTNWLTSHAAIREHVSIRVPGRRCQFCRIQEPPTSLELVPIEPERRGKLEILDGVVQLQTKQVIAHLQCIPHWERWRALGESYQSQEEAEAADIAAGRTAGALPALPNLEPENPSEDDGPQHFSSEEQQ